MSRFKLRLCVANRVTLFFRLNATLELTRAAVTYSSSSFCTSPFCDVKSVPLSKQSHWSSGQKGGSSLQKVSQKSLSRSPGRVWHTPSAKERAKKSKKKNSHQLGFPSPLPTDSDRFLETPVQCRALFKSLPSTMWAVLSRTSTFSRNSAFSTLAEREER